MKIAMDAFALGLAQGTGIARYALELSRVLAARHEVFPVYGLNRIGWDPELLWPRFVQSLLLRGEADSGDIRRWGPYSALYFLNYLAGLPIRARKVVHDGRIDTSSVADRLPSFAGIYNLPSVYRSVQAYSFLFRRPLHLRLGEGVDLWHSTMPMPIKVVGAKCVVTAHDIVPIVLPHSTGVNLRHYRRMVEQSYAGADMIFAVSEYTKRDLLAHFDLPERKIFVTYQSAHVPQHLLDAERKQVAGFLRKAFGLDYGNYFLFYGAIEPKKNVLRVVEAICDARTDMPIVIAGKSGWLDADVAALIERLRSETKGRRRVVVRIDYLPFERLMLLLKGARGLVFPSLYEGFGIPLLEAMLMGCPVITSKGTSLPEVCGDAALYVDPLNVKDISEAIDALASNDDLAAELVRRGKAQAARFSRECYASRLEEGYRLALDA